ncbi:hypothetical protein, partial [uncultured Rikenella sp.]|uniref:hypothetical protein n=1 Tax=uncultured Rikenella sp. TaxID=368003 RepID=UPI002613FF8E
SPILRPVSASLRLRFRSAAFAVARWDFISILLTAKQVKSLFRRASDGVFRTIILCSRACAIHSISATAEMIESLL